MQERRPCLENDVFRSLFVLTRTAVIIWSGLECHRRPYSLVVKLRPMHRFYRIVSPARAMRSIAMAFYTNSRGSPSRARCLLYIKRPN